MENAAKKLIIALDDIEHDELPSLVKKTSRFANTYKVGLSLFCGLGPKIVVALKDLGVEVFLDLKLHDIPMQVSKAVEECLRLEPRFLTLHALGGARMLKEAQERVFASNTTLLAVSVLTSMDKHSWQALGFDMSIEESVLHLLSMAHQSGVKGFVASAQEAQLVKTQFKSDCILVCPGVRPKDGELNDQKRTMTAGDAIRAGADYLVVGRPITKSKDVAMSAELINQEIAQSMCV